MFSAVYLHLTSKVVSVQAVKEVVMGSRLRDAAPHGGEDSLQLQRDVMIVLLHA